MTSLNGGSLGTRPELTYPRAALLWTVRQRLPRHHQGVRQKSPLLPVRGLLRQCHRLPSRADPSQLPQLLALFRSSLRVSPHDHQAFLATFGLLNHQHPPLHELPVATQAALQHPSPVQEMPLVTQVAQKGRESTPPKGGVYMASVLRVSLTPPHPWHFEKRCHPVLKGLVHFTLVCPTGGCHHHTLCCPANVSRRTSTLFRPQRCPPRQRS